MRRALVTVTLVAFAALAAVLMMWGPAHARPLMGQEVEIREPDGSTITLKVWGDEFYAVGETEDGFSVVRDDATGLLSYAKLSADGRSLVSTGVPATQAPPLSLRRHIRIDPSAAREKAIASRTDFETRSYGAPLSSSTRASRGPTTGSVVGIVLLIDFSDDPGTISTSDVDDYCNLFGYTGYGNNGSVRDYYYDVSEGLLDYTNYVPVQYYRAQNPKSYYTDPNVSYGTRARELIEEALEAMDAAGFDFSLYDADGNGYIDALNCFYAGGVWNSWAEGLWPHSGGFSWCADGVCTRRYQITDMGSSLALGTFVHENGHMLMGWPDLYDYDYDSTGAGTYCVMSYGSFDSNPVEPSAYMKYDAGWADMTDLLLPQGGLSAPGDGNTMFRFEHPTLSNEYYLVENRQRSGRDSGLPDDGLAIWHIDTEGSNNWQQQDPLYHYLVTLVQADGDWDLENDRNYGDGTDLYGASRYPECTPLTYPDTDWWDGTESGASFANISSSGSVMTFDFLNDAYMLDLATALYAQELDYLGSATYTATLKNWAGVTDATTVSVGHDSLPPGVGAGDWIVSYREAGGSWQTAPLEVVLGPGEETTLEVRVSDGIGTQAGMALSTISATSSISGLTATETFATFVDLPSILLLDDDKGGTAQTYIETALADTGYAAMTWEVGSRGRPSLELLSSFGAVIWSTGSGSTAYISGDDEQNMMDYLDAGGNLLFASQEYLTERSSANTFITDYLHIDSWTADTGGFSVQGVDGDLVTGGMSLLLLGGPFQANYSDSFVPAAPADSILTAPTGVKGLKVEEAGHKVVFLAFPVENVNDGNPSPDNLRTFLTNVINWFEGTTGVGDPLAARHLFLAQNAPNPFNPVTRIAFMLPRDSEAVSLRVYDVAGRLVRTLIDGPREAGSHSVVWDGTGEGARKVASGVYFARLSTDEGSAVRKMALLK